MGIADYGISPIGAYEYSTNRSLGKVTIVSLQTQNATGDPWMSFQLNVNLAFTNDNRQYVYWVQDFAQVDTSSNQFYFVDNIWNSSSPSASMTASAISGGGKVAFYNGTGYYLDRANLFGFSLSYPTTVSFLVEARVNSLNQPVVSFAYDDGSGFQTYDTATFVSANSLTSLVGFEVNGNNYNPARIFYDSELVLGGVCCGYNTTGIQSNVRLALYYWNSHNYQTVSNAYNFGSDTAEGTTNLKSEWYYFPPTGSLIAEVQAGSGSLGKLYDQSEVGIIDIKSPLGSGTLYVSNSSNTFATPASYLFVNGEVTVVVYPGTYLLQMKQNGVLYDQGTKTVDPGQILHLQTPLNDIQITMNYSTLGDGSGFTPPELTYVHSGSQQTVTLGTTPTTYYMDPGTVWTVTGNLATATERWQTNQTTSGTASSLQTIEFTYFHQYLVTFGSVILGGGSGYGLSTIGYLQFRSLKTTPTDSPVWVDAGSSYSYTNPLSGSTASERWYSTVASGVINGANNVITQFYHQFALTASYTILRGGGAAYPSLNGTQFGGPYTTTLATNPRVYWLDSGSTWSLTNPLTGSTDQERWQTNSTTSGLVNSASTLSQTYYHQYALTLSYSIVGGGNPTVPAISGKQFGQTYAVPLSGNPTAYFLDSGSSWTVPNPLVGISSQERWEMSGSANGTISGAATAEATYHHQYLLSTSFAPLVGGSITALNGWYDSGTALQLSASPMSGWKFGGWVGTGSASYTGDSNSTSIVVGSPMSENASFYPGLKIIATDGGSVSYTFGLQSGTVSPGASQTIYIPAGTTVSLVSSASSLLNDFTGWSAAANGTNGKIAVELDSPEVVQANFSYNYVVIAGIVGALVAVPTGSILVIRSKKTRSKSPIKP